MKNFISVVFLFYLFLSTSGYLFSQIQLPVNAATGLIEFSGKTKVNRRSKKKIMKITKEWTSTKLQNPGMVFSTAKTTKDSLWLKAMTEIPSMKHLHPVSFDLLLVVERKHFYYRATNFKFEDIDLTLDKWLEKYAHSDNERHQKNVDFITKGVDSHIAIAIRSLKEKINQ